MLYKINMKVEENIRLTKLYDAYGALLSTGQREIMKSYLYDDLTVSEIAENLLVSRQAVKDSITKAERKLDDFEKRLEFVKRFELVQAENERLTNEIDKLKKRK